MLFSFGALVRFGFLCNFVEVTQLSWHCLSGMRKQTAGRSNRVAPSAAWWGVSVVAVPQRSG